MEALQRKVPRLHHVHLVAVEEEVVVEVGVAPVVDGEMQEEQVRLVEAGIGNLLGPMP